MDDALLDESAIRIRVGTLVARDVLPRVAPRRIVARPSLGGQTCVACGAVIAKLDGGYKIESSAVLFYFHWRCFELWVEVAQEVEGEQG
jgi:hypothetical protein